MARDPETDVRRGVRSTPWRRAMNQTTAKMATGSSIRPADQVPGACSMDAAAVPLPAMAATTLSDIIAHKRGEIAAGQAAASFEALAAAAADAAPPRDLVTAVSGGDGVRIIAEVKRRSPSAGELCGTFDPVAIAKAYEKAGASAISCLTDEAFFGGDLAYIAAIKEAVGLPVLRKDFIIDPWQVVESRAVGADAILLIAEALPSDDLAACMGDAHALGMATLLEAHGRAEVERIAAIAAASDGPCLVGINNRDLATMQTDIEHTISCVDLVADKACLVSESGISGGDDLRRLRACGVGIVLVGESLMRSGDPGAALAALLSGT